MKLLIGISAFFLLILPTSQSVHADDHFQFSLTSDLQHWAQVDTAFASEISLKVVDPSDSSAGVGDVPVTFSAPASGPSGTFPDGSNTVTVDSVGSGEAVGMVHMPTFTANDVTGSYTIQATAPGVSLTLSFSMTNTTGPPDGAASVSMAGGSNQTAEIETQFATMMSATVFDAHGVHLSGVTVEFSAPEEGPSGTFSDTGTNTTSVVTGGTGQATAPNFTANDEVGSYSVTATVSADQTIEGDPLTATFSLLNSIEDLTGLPYSISNTGGSGQSAQLLAQFNTNFSVAIFDGSSEHVVDATVTFLAPEQGPSGTFANGSNEFEAVTGSDGMVTAPAFTANDVAGSYSVQVISTKGGVTATGSVGLTNLGANTTTTLSREPDGNTVFGQTLVLTVEVEADNPEIEPDGLVAFLSSGSTIEDCDEVSVDNGIAECEIASLPVGSHQLRADYLGGDSTNESSSDPISHTVNKADTTLTLETSEPQFVLEGESVTFTASVTVDPPGAGEPSGTVTFTSSDGTPLNNGDPVTLVDGETQVSTSALDTGTPQITATYSGDDNFNDSNDDLTQNVYTIPEVTDQPSDTLALVDEQASFSAAASGFPNPEIQWQISTDDGESFEDIPNADEATYSFTPAFESDQHQFRAVFSNPAGSDTSDAATLTVRQLAEITSDDSATFTVGEEGSFTVTATGILEPVLSRDGDLPSGVTFDESTGLLSGIPTVGTGEVYSLTFTATNDVDPPAVQNFTLTVNEAPAITSLDEITFVVGASGSFAVTATGQPQPDLSLSGDLPGGVSFEESSGLLLGTPDAGTGGTYPLTIVAANGIGSDAEQNFTLLVHEAPAITSDDVTTFLVGSPGSFSVVTTGVPDPDLELSGTLPDGVIFEANSGELSGTPEAGTGGVYELTFTASNDVDPEAVQNFTVTVNEAPAITSDGSTTFEVGEEGTFTVTAIGYPVPTLSLDGTLPGGVSFEASTGTLSGTPDDATGGSYQLTITAGNGIEPDFEQPFTLIVNQPPEITSDAATTFEVGSAGSFAVAATGYPVPGFSLDGELPAGLTLDEDSGEISGTPAPGTGGIHQFELTASNGVDPDSQQNFTMTVNEAPRITSADSTTFVFDAPGDFTFTATGFPEPSLSVSGTLPSGISFDDSDTLSGTPEEAGVFDLTVTAENSVLPDATQQFTLTVDRAEQETLIAIVEPASGVTGDRLTLGTTGGSGTGDVTFDAGSSDACELGTGDDAGFLVIVDGVGTCEVVAHKDGDEFYQSTTSDPVAVEVSRAEPTLTVESADGTYGGITSLVATLTIGDTPLDSRTLEFELNGTEVGTGVTDENGAVALAEVDLAGIDAGEYPDGVRVTFDGDSGYLPAAGTGPLVVAKAEGRVRINNIPSTANVGSSLQPHYSVDGDGQPAVTSQTPSVCTVSGGVVHFQDSGVCALQASVGEGTNHLAATGPMQFVLVVQSPANVPDSSDDDSDSEDEHSTAGPPATITFEIHPDQYTVGMLVTIVVTVLDEDDNPVDDGTEVSFQVLREEELAATAQFLDHASIQVVETEDGQATFEYTNDSPGIDTVVVTAGDVEVAINIEWTSAEPAFECVEGFGDPAFEHTWARTDLPVRDGSVRRTWMWGPCAFTDSIFEPYLDSPDGDREVRYFDKARMEINDPAGDSDSLWYVTNGLLVVEMITGQRQFGDDLFVSYEPAHVNVAGDPDDPESPTYASFQALLGASAQPVGTLLTERVDRDGTVSAEDAYREHGVTVAFADEVTHHGIATPFWEFMNSQGLVHLDGELAEEALFENPFYATGRPITGAYWATVRVDGEYRDVLMQCFERRCLTYTPGNPEGFVVEAGNVGQHYYSWRYVREPDQ